MIKQKGRNLLEVSTGKNARLEPMVPMFLIVGAICLFWALWGMDHLGAPEARTPQYRIILLAIFFVAAGLSAFVYLAGPGFRVDLEKEKIFYNRNGAPEWFYVKEVQEIFLVHDRVEVSGVVEKNYDMWHLQVFVRGENTTLLTFCDRESAWEAARQTSEFTGKQFTGQRDMPEPADAE